MPTNTDLVTDLPADFEVFGQAVDTSLADLKGGTTGQVLSKTTNADMDFTWIANDQGDITGVTAGTGILVTSPTGPVPTVTFDIANYGGGQYAAGKNAIINGDFYWNQRAFTSTTSSATFTFDRFNTNATDGTTTFTAQTFTLGSEALTGSDSPNYLQIATTGQTLSTALSSIAQKVEGVRTFAGQTVTMSFYAKASAGTPNITAFAAQNFGSGGSTIVFTGSTKKAISTSWARYSFTIPVPSISGKTVGAGDHIRFDVCVSAGTDRNAYTDSLGIQTGTFQVWGVQVEIGSTATPFQTASGSIGGELALCQRYLPAIASPNGELFTGQAYSTTAALVPVIFPVTARVAPTGITVNSAGNFRLRGATATKITTTAINFSTGTPQGCTIEGIVAAGLVAGNATNLFNESSGTILFTGCEL